MLLSNSDVSETIFGRDFDVWAIWAKQQWGQCDKIWTNILTLWWFIKANLRSVRPQFLLLFIYICDQIRPIFLFLGKFSISAMICFGLFKAV